MISKEVFETYWLAEPMSGCWLWERYIARNGYGVLTLPGRIKITAHRLSWNIYRGQIPDKLCVLHKCDTRSCVNPDHLFLGTYNDNIQDMCRKGRHGHSKKMSCPYGHVYSGLNLGTFLLSKTGSIGRFCRKCARLRAAIHYLKKTVILIDPPGKTVNL